MYCCTGFENLIASAGQRGISVLVKQSETHLSFRLQSRGVSFDDLPKIRPIPEAPDIIINVSCTLSLKHCPSCGKRLQKLINASPAHFEELAKAHKKYLPDDPPIN